MQDLIFKTFVLLKFIILKFIFMKLKMTLNVYVVLQ